MLQKKYIPYSALYELTLRCNLNCIHCGSSAGFKRDAELTTDQWNSITDELVKMKCKQINILGGEPFLRKDWYEISKYIRDNGIRLVIISNGMLINEKIIEKLKRLDLYAIAISLDGGTAKTHDYIRQKKGSFEKCLKVMSDLIENGIPTTAITTLNKLNFKELPLIRDILLNKGIVWQLQIAVPLGRFSKKFILSKEEFYAAGLFISKIRKQYSYKELPIVGAHCFGYFSNYLPNMSTTPDWTGCQAGVTTMAIQSNGDVKGCLSLPDEFIEGNINEKKHQRVLEWQ